MVPNEKIYFSQKSSAIAFANEVRNRLNAIRLHTDLIERVDSVSPKLKRHLAIIQQEVAKLDMFVTELLQNTAVCSASTVEKYRTSKEK